MVNPKIPSIEDYFKAVQSRPPEPAYIENIQPQQPGEYSIIAGKTGIGKTNLALQLGFCCSTGMPFHVYRCNKAVVGFLSLEGDDQNMMARYQKLEKQFPNTNSYLRYDRIEKGRPTKMLEEVKTKIQGCNIVILDGGRFLMSKYCNTEESQTFVVEFMTMLKEQGAVAILTLQLKKTDPRYLLEPGDVFSIKGATDIVDGSTTIILLEHTRYSKNKLDTTLYFAKNRISPVDLPEVNLCFDKTICRFKVKP